MYQQITLIGNLGNDPEMRYTPSGVAVASFSLAVSKSWTTEGGEKQDKTTWFRVTCWRKQAEVVSQYLGKGKQVMVVGEVEEARAFTDKSGNQRASLEVTATTVRFLSGGKAEAAAGNGQEPAAGVGDEEIPF